MNHPDPEAPDLGSRHLVAHVDNRVLHVRVDRVEKRNAFTQDMYRGTAEWILEQIRSTGPVARATIKRDLNAQLRPSDVAIEKRAAVWPRP